MKNAVFIVPATTNMGTFTGTAVAGPTDTLTSDARMQYNRVRARDGLPPVRRMPAGTYYKLCTVVYINRIGGGLRETIDEFSTRKEARDMLAEYRMADPAGYYYLSSRHCANWRD